MQLHCAEASLPRQRPAWRKAHLAFQAQAAAGTARRRQAPGWVKPAAMSFIKVGQITNAGWLRFQRRLSSAVQRRRRDVDVTLLDTTVVRWLDCAPALTLAGVQA